MCPCGRLLDLADFDRRDDASGGGCESSKVRAARSFRMAREASDAGRRRVGVRVLTGVDAERIRAVIASGETFTVEFKGEGREPLKDRDLIEAVVCLANGRGGLLLVGVEDDGTVTGARPRHGSNRTDPLRLQALLANSTQPPVLTTVDTIEVDGRPVLCIDVDDSQRVVGTTRGTYLRRAVGGDGRPTCLPFHAHEMLAYEIDRGAVDYATIPLTRA